MTRGRNPNKMGLSDWAITQSKNTDKKKRPTAQIYQKLWSENITDEEIRNIFDEYEITSTAYNCVIENKNASVDIKADINYLYSLNVFFGV